MCYTPLQGLWGLPGQWTSCHPPLEMLAAVQLTASASLQGGRKTEENLPEVGKDGE